jgi:excisionase family DNA binding protein
MQDTDDRRLLTKKETAKLLGISAASLERLMRRDLLYVKIGNLVRFRHSDLMNHIEKNVRSGNQPTAA